jgi:diguanylate cyclase (GGDEF)-like protein/PAS domain S-box-containing protein
MDAQALDRALTVLLDQHPEAVVSALNADGLRVTMPASVPLNDHKLLAGRSALHLVAPRDVEVMITTWERARHTGAARATVELGNSPGRSAELYFFDVREHHGVFVVVLLAEDGAAQDALNSIPDGPAVVTRFSTTRKNELAVLVAIDEATTEMLGWTPDEMVGQRSLEFIHPDDRERAVESWMEMLARPGKSNRVRLRHQRRDGSWLWLEITNHNLLEDPSHGYVRAELMDISDEMAAHEALRAREQLLHRLAEALPLGVFQVGRDGAVVYANERLGEIVGVPPCGTVRDQLGSVSADDWPSLDEALGGVLVDGRDATLEVRLRRPASDELRFSRILLRSLTDDAGEVSGAIVCVEDVTESVRLRGELEHRATYDVLTRCHNRASIMSALEAALARSATSTTGVAFLDVDGFKSVNDSLGHAAGDELLVVVADRLRAAVRGRDIVGRFGGDEFLVVCPDVGDRAEAVALAERVRASVHGTVTVAHTALDLRVSVGVAWTSGEHVTAELLVARADAMMYESKRRGDGRPTFASTGPVSTSDG